MLADDSKIYRTISSVEDVNVYKMTYVHNIINCCSQWLMDLNFDKCRCMSFGNGALPMNQYIYSPGDDDIPVVRAHSILISEYFLPQT